jgi:ABC-type glycerol-3-phosphate transport system substrate-binding protein
MNRIFIIAAVLMISACSGSDGTTADQAEPEKDGNHVWKTQTDQMDRARDVENVLQQSHERNMQDIDEQAR